jgi:hypothetical protein
MKMGMKTHGQRFDVMKTSTDTRQTSGRLFFPPNFPVDRFCYINYKIKPACAGPLGYAVRPHECVNAETWNIKNFRVKKINTLNFVIFINILWFLQK